MGGHGSGGGTRQAVKGQIISMGIGGVGGKGVYRAGSWVPVQVKLENRSGSPFVGHLGVEQPDLDGDKVISVGPEFVLQPGVEAGGNARTFWTYYWPRPDDQELAGIRDVVVLDKTGQTVVSKVSTPDGQAAGAGIGRRDEQTERSTRFVVVVGKSWAGWDSFVGAWGGTEAIRGVWVNSPSDLPDDVKGFDGVDVVVWEADDVKVSDFRPEFELKAMLAWVKAGGHLIISVGTQWQELDKGGRELADALPMKITGTRELVMKDLAEFPEWSWSGGLGNRIGNKPSEKPLIQVIGSLRISSRPVIAEPRTAMVDVPGAKPDDPKRPGSFINHPLVVTGLFGQGAVTLVTFNVDNPEMLDKDRVTKNQWMMFWNQAAGWRQQTRIYSQEEFDAKNKQDNNAIATTPEPIPVGQDLPATVDVTEVTAVRIFVAILFLAAYWLLAGPLGHLVLRFYKAVHWSWWIFGGTVVAATAVAGAVVLVLHVTSYDVRHRSFVMGTVNSDDVTVASFYGVYAPLSGAVELRQPAGGGAGSITLFRCAFRRTRR